MNLETRLGPLVLQNPVILASGTCGYGREMVPFLDLDRVGAITLKGLSVMPWEGNPPPRIHETAAGVMNSIGLENKGFHRFVQDDLSWLETVHTRVIANVWGRTEEEYIGIARLMDRLERIDAVEVNVSCPNVEKGGESFATNCRVLHQLIGAIRRVVQKTLLVKIGPTVAELEKTLKFMEREGVDGLSVTNTFPALAVDSERQCLVFERKVAGLSGPAIKPLALKLVYDVRHLTHLPIIGMGGIMKTEDALEFLLIGASAIAVGTANLVDPAVALEIVPGIESYLVAHGMNRLDDLIGKVR
ncbi:MAG: dihydroorotate dehydrogenase [Candidatus Atribacteria bacterium]|nr:dihydroorotate dehydrogenase [Candidatus Atribacteria bacterium]